MADDNATTPTLLDKMLRESGALGPSTPSTRASGPTDDNKSFGSGLRRGFLDRERAPRRAREKAQQQAKKAIDSIPTITRSTSSSLVLPEVRAAMDREAQERAEGEQQHQARGGLPPALQSLLGRGDWVTSELQERILATPALREALLNPRLARVLEELGRDPQAALKRHNDDPAVAAFLRALSTLLGAHFEALGQQQQQQQQQQLLLLQEGGGELRGPLIEEALRQQQAGRGRIVDVTGLDPEGRERERREQAAADEILRDPEVCALLLDPEVQAVLQACRDAQQQRDRDARGKQEALARRMREPEMAGKLRRLAAAGVLRFE